MEGGRVVTLTEFARRLGTRHGPVRNPLYNVLIGLTTLAILLQGLWAGLFIHEGHDFRETWVDVHARNGEAAIAFAALASILALVKLRSRPGIVIGSISLTVLLVVEAYVGGLIGDMPAMTVVHVPLALAAMGLAIWLSTRATWGMRATAPHDIAADGADD